jgi:hypothetical protein
MVPAHLLPVRTAARQRPGVAEMRHIVLVVRWIYS